MKIRLATLLILTVVTTISLCENTNHESTNSQQSSEGFSLYEIKRRTLSSGGGVISAGNYTLTSSIGQIDAGHNATSGIYEFNGGFLTRNSDLIKKNNFD